MPPKLPGDYGTDSYQNACQGVHAQVLIDLETEGLSLSSIGRLADLTEVTTLCLLWPEPETCARGRRRNAPGRDKVRIELIRRLVTHCGQNLSEDEVPRETALVDTLARTPRRPCTSLGTASKQRHNRLLMLE
jgi:hypothetical protein